MRMVFVAFAFAGTTTAALAQSPAPVPVTAQQAAPAAKPQTVKKTVCKRVDDEETTGSRIGSAPKICKTIEVPVNGSGGANGAQAPRPERG